MDTNSKSEKSAIEKMDVKAAVSTQAAASSASTPAAAADDVADMDTDAQPVKDGGPERKHADAAFGRFQEQKIETTKTLDKDGCLAVRCYPPDFDMGNVVALS